MPAGSAAGRPRPARPPGPTSEAELHLPLAAARQPGEPPDANAEGHGAGGGQRGPARPGVTQPRLAGPVRPPAPRPGTPRAAEPPPRDRRERGGGGRLAAPPASAPRPTGTGGFRGWDRRQGPGSALGRPNPAAAPARSQLLRFNPSKANRGRREKGRQPGCLQPSEEEGRAPLTGGKCWATPPRRTRGAKRGQVGHPSTFWGQRLQPGCQLPAGQRRAPKSTEGGVGAAQGTSPSPSQDGDLGHSTPHLLQLTSPAQELVNER